MIMVVITVAVGLGEQFIKYYDQMMSVLKHLMTDMLNEEDQELTGTIMECVTAIGMAVGKDKVGSNVKHVIYRNIIKRLHHRCYMHMYVQIVHV